MANIKGNVTNNKMLTYHIYDIYTDHAMSVMVCQISLCVYACLKQKTMPNSYGNDSNPQREYAY